MRTRAPRFESQQRARILDAAVRVFAEKGYRGATTRVLGRAARVNSALIYYYFENKHTLFAEAIRMIMRGFMERLQDRHASLSGARDRLGYLVNGIFDYYLEHPDRMRLMFFTLLLYPALFTEALRSFVKEQPVVPIQILQDGMNSGELSRMHPLQAWWSILGLCMFSLLTRDVVPNVGSQLAGVPLFKVGDRKTQIVDLLMRGLATPKEASMKSKKELKR